MASTQINYTQGTPTNAIKYTLSMWVKRSNTFAGDSNYLASVWVDGNNHWCMRFNDDQLDIYDYISSSTTTQLKTNRKFRDCASWYNIIYVYDSANSTAGDRQKIYVNGVEETSFATDTNPSSSAASVLNVSGRVLTLGARNSASYFDGLMSHVQFVDGLALTPTAFGEFNSTDGMWKMKTASYATAGANGFHLKMEDSSNLDLDSSSNGHTFTTSGTLTATKDCPDNNMATFNPLDNFYFGSTFTNGNNTTATPSSTYAMGTSTLGMTKGKYYVEAKLSAGYPQLKFGITNRPAEATNETMAFSGSTCFSGTGTLVLDTATTSSWGSTFAVGDIIGCAVDLDNNRIYFSINGSWQSGGNPSAGTGYETIVAPSSTEEGVYHFAWSDNKSDGGSTMQYNFGNGYFGTTAVTSAGSNASGNGIFEYDVPTGGFTALSTKGLNL